MNAGFKDLFSKQAATYARFRPVYPMPLIEHLASLAPGRGLAWDCATGNGQAALQLACLFDRVIATDASQDQLKSAAAHPKVGYRRAAAEDCGLEAGSVDLVTVAQAFHWFKQEPFFAEVKRVLKPGGVLALWCYELARITPEVDAVILDFYKNTLDGCWEAERLPVEEGYRNVSIPFDEIAAPPFVMTASWSLAELVGYLGTWSAVQTYIKKNGQDPLRPLAAKLKSAWAGAPRREARWDMALRIGRALKPGFQR